jgi:hypothetical protein
MKPNLFRSISDSLSEQFPLLPRIRKSFIGLLMFCALFFAMGITETDGILLSVKPLPGSQFNDKPVANYAEGNVALGGQLTILNPGFIERAFLPDATTDIDSVTLLFLAAASVIIILVLPKVKQENLFRKDISTSIRLLGYLVMAHGIFSIYRILEYAPKRIEAITNHEFTTIRSFPLMTMAELYFSLIVIAVAGIYKRGIKLQEEQDLTV